jgi:hypothetical protein
MLKKLAVDYMHPEKPVQVTDATVFGRNYFERSYISTSDDVDEMERAQALADARDLKKLAVGYLHPEIGVKVTDPTACSRNYFSRPSAKEYELSSQSKERVAVLGEAASLKMFARDYLHPEVPVVTNDAMACGRNYFDRFGASQSEDKAERDTILADAAELKKYAVDYMSPEVHVKACDATLFGRNYFYRAGAPEGDDDEVMVERQAILADMMMLKASAVDYMQPERSVTTSDSMACGRSYFSRASAAGHRNMIHTFPPHVDDESHHEESTHHQEHLDYFHMDEDMGCEMFDDMRMQFMQVGLGGPTKKKQARVTDDSSETEEGKLSRSPSSVMLFTEESIYD